MPVMSNTVAVLLGLAVIAGACLVMWWLRTGRVEPAKGQRGRLRKLAWCAGLLVLSAMVLSTLHPLLVRHNLSWLIVVAIAAAVIIIFLPGLPARIVPVALILYGLSGFAVARDYASGGVDSYGVTTVGNAGSAAALILPQAYALLLLGGWLALRSTDPVLVRARFWLGPVARAPLGAQLRTLALLPVVAVLTGLLAPRLWLAGGAALILTVALVWGVVLLIRRWPARAAQLTTVGLLCLGIAGLAIVAFWHANLVFAGTSSASAQPAFIKPGPSSAASSPSAGASSASASPASRKPTLRTAAPVKIPASPSGGAAPSECAALFKRPALFKNVRGAVPLKCAELFKRGAPPALNPPPAQPAPAADVTDVVWGQALPYGAVLVDSQAAADAAGVQGLAFLALATWLAPQTFPLVRRLLGGTPDPELTRRVERLTQSRAVAVDTASADLRRLERDLHDGAQARLVALGMSLRAAERLIPTSPDAAAALVAEAREASVKALTELRELVRGVLPPVLADRGLADAVRALALDSPLHVETDIELPGRLPAPVETACYFAVAELLTNAVKHSGARDARISVSHSGRLLRLEVTDFGLGGADPAKGSGLAGVERRLATFDGILAVSSPVGGPTVVVMEVPCAISSPKSSSG